MKDTAPARTEQQNSNLGLRFIAGFKILQGLALALVGTGLLILISKEANGQFAHWVDVWQLNTDNKLVLALLSQLDKLTPLKFERLSAGAFLYAVLLLTEGTGLLLRKHWAEYFTVLVTGSFLPWELFEIVRHFNVGALLLFAANAAVVWYLVRNLQTNRLQSKA